jgi:hypothetical protein
MAAVPSAWDRNGVDRFFTEVVRDLVLLGDRKPSEVAAEAREAVAASYRLAFPGNELPAYLRQLALAPQATETADLDVVASVSDLHLVDARTRSAESPPDETTPVDELLRAFEELARMGEHEGNCTPDERGVCEKHGEALAVRLTAARAMLAKHKKP